MTLYVCRNCANQNTSACNTCMTVSGRRPTEYKSKESDDMTNVSVLKDELGLQREYREVKRKAAVGERIKVVKKSGSLGEYTDGSVLTVTKAQRWEHPVDENGVSAEGVSAGIFHSEYVVLEPTDIVRIDGVRYRLVERKANVGERVVVVNQWFGSDTYRNGDVLTIDGMNGVDACVSSVATEDNPKGYLSLSEYRVLEPLKSAKLTVDIGANPDVLGLLANLSTRLAEAERKIAELEYTKVDRMLPRKASGIERVPSEGVRVELTRDDVIERAKADVARLKEQYCGCSTLKFVVNREKRTVVALIFNGSYLYGRGKAKAAPDDVFNAAIGRAIALRRALGLDVPDAYVNAPKPTEAKVGDIVRCKLTHKAYTVVPDFTWDGDELSIEYVNGRGLKSSDGVYISDDSREEVTA